ncbi:glycosyltransferase family 87 protein [Candidatus Binatus sp.]|uniref:glycosyltransferase family 87 protein n=1 Tax=Candidatus Binatus sp. TaxID=2811406 RepID=UPI003BB06850
MLRAIRERLKSVIAWFAEAPWLNRERLRIYPKIFLLAYALTFTLWVMTLHGIVSHQGKPIGVDFEVNWAASEMALRGEPSAVYNFKRFHAMEEEAVGKGTFAGPWIYPPTFLIVVLPQALLPYLWSLAIWMTLTAAGYILVLRKIIPRTETFWPALAFPGAFANLMNGQNGLLAFSVLGVALLTVESNPLLGGAFFGLLTYKPPMGVLVPFVLAATGRWRAFWAAAFTASALAAISFVMFGAETWRAFFNTLGFTRQMVIENGGVRFYTMQSVFAAARLLGGGVAAAYSFQIVAAATGAAIVIWIWRQNIRFELKASAFAVGMVLASPYILYYDLVILALPIAWLALEGRRSGFLPFEKSLLVIAWILPLACESVAHYAFIPLTPLVSVLMLGFIIRRVRVAAIVPAPAMATAASL